MREWYLVAHSYSGWSIEDIKSLSIRERRNWIELAKEHGKVVRKK